MDGEIANPAAGWWFLAAFAGFAAVLVVRYRVLPTLNFKGPMIRFGGPWTPFTRKFREQNPVHTSPSGPHAAGARRFAYSGLFGLGALYLMLDALY